MNAVREGTYGTGTTSASAAGSGRGICGGNCVGARVKKEEEGGRHVGIIAIVLGEHADSFASLAGFGHAVGYLSTRMKQEKGR